MKNSCEKEGATIATRRQRMPPQAQNKKSCSGCRDARLAKWVWHINTPKNALRGYIYPAALNFVKTAPNCNKMEQGILH
jgi:hypothetical protein